MEETWKKAEAEAGETDIVFSKSIKAGKRIYYLDVKKNRRGELFLAITESKKIMVGYGEEARFGFEKHKIFLYREDFAKFADGLNQVISFINSHPAVQVQTPEGSDAKLPNETDCVSSASSDPSLPLAGD